MAAREDSLDLLLGSLFEGGFVVDGKGSVTFWSPASEQITGFAAGDTVGQPYKGDFFRIFDATGHPLDDDNPVRASLRDGERRELEGFVRHRKGHLVPVRLRTVALPRGDGKGRQVVTLFADQSERLAIRRDLEDLKDQTLIDAESGAASRQHTEQDVVTRLSELGRYGWGFGVALVAVDGWAELGAHVGEVHRRDVARMVANTLLGAVRSSDLVGRWQDDVFVVLLANVDAEGLQIGADRFRRLVRGASTRLMAENVTVTASVGATLALPNDGIGALISRAGDLLQQSHRAGGDRVSVATR